MDGGEGVEGPSHTGKFSLPSVVGTGQRVGEGVSYNGSWWQSSELGKSLSKCPRWWRVITRLQNRGITEKANQEKEIKHSRRSEE